MLKNHLTVAIRNLRRNAGFTFINVAGLALGIACCILILLHVREELSYDTYHENADRIYRVVSEHRRADDASFGARTPVPLGPVLKDEYPEVDEVVRFWRAFQPVLRHEETIVRESERLYFTDPAVFDVLTFDFVAGDPATALVEPETMVITETMAHRYFGDENPMGRSIGYEGYPGRSEGLTFAVTGVIRDLPPNTHMDFEGLASLVGIDTEADNFGSWKPLWTYVLLPPGANPRTLESKLPDFVERHMASETSTTILRLEPVTDVHLRSRYGDGFKAGSSTTYVVLFVAVGLFILTIACINFVNLATARSMSRAREVGMRKVLGAYRPQLVGQFLGEAVLLSAMALVLAIVIVYAALPVFNGLFQTSLALRLASDPFLLLALPSLALVVGLVAGIYPAVFLAGFGPVAAMKGRLIARRSGAHLRKALVVFQFAISVTLIAGTAIVYQQLDYIRGKELGIDKEQVVVMPHARTGQEEAMMAAMRRNASVISVAESQRVPVNTINSDGRPVLPEGFDETVRVDSYIIDADFVETFGVEIVAGRNISDAFPTDTAAFLINETAARRFGWAADAAPGKKIFWTSGPTTGPVVGVVRDFHLESLHDEIPPLVMHMRPQDEWWRTFVSAKIRPDDVAGTLAFLEDTWRRFAPDGAYEYFFIDESFAALHRADARFGPIFRLFAVLAIGIACLGLFGLAAFTTEQRAKEVGVRKVLGASVAGLVMLLSHDFAKLVTIAFVIAAPLAYFAMTRWLEGFAYRVQVSWSTFLIAGIVALGVAMLTVSFQAIRSAISDPVRVLRYE